MPGEFDVGIERLGAVARQPHLARLPVIVIGTRVMRRQPAITGLRAAAEAEIGRDLVRTRSRRQDNAPPSARNKRRVFDEGGHSVASRQVSPCIVK